MFIFQHSHDRTHLHYMGFWIATQLYLGVNLLALGMLFAWDAHFLSHIKYPYLNRDDVDFAWDMEVGASVTAFMLACFYLVFAVALWRCPSAFITNSKSKLLAVSFDS